MAKTGEIHLDQEKRAALLRPYMDRLGGLERHRDAEGKATTIHVGARSFRIDPWERERILAHLGEDEAGSWESLLVEGAALQTRTLVDLDSAEPDTDASQLVLDTAIGLKMMEDAQGVINRMILSGQMEEARQLTRFRNKIGQVLQDLKQAIGENQVAEAEAIAGIQPAQRLPEETELPGSDEPASTEDVTSGVLNDLADNLEQAASAGAVDPTRAPRRSKARPAVWALTVSLVALGAVSLLTREAPTVIEPLQPVAFTATPEITYAQCVPPSILARVDNRAWLEMGDEGRYRLVENASRIASVAGYTGVLLSDNQGTVLAQWLRDEGIRILLPAPQSKPALEDTPLVP